MLLPYILALGLLLFTLWFLRSGREWISGRHSRIALNSTKFQSFQLQEKITVSPDTCIFRFALRSPQQILGLPIGQHIYIRGHSTNSAGKRELVQHAYTPISSDEEVGHVDFLIKVYHKNVHPKYPSGGRLSQYLYHLPLGSMVEMRGPVGRFEYQGHGNFTINNNNNNNNNKSVKQQHTNVFTMVAGGTGITPLLQLIRAILRTPQDSTRIFLVYANRTEADILLREELDKCAKDPRMKVWYVLSGAAPADWKYSTGHITEEILREHVPVLNEKNHNNHNHNRNGENGENGEKNGVERKERVFAVMCGPPMMLRQAVRPNLEKLGYTAENMFEF
ncbi:Flavoprotein pyridine nucleotide cytochrome reductase-like [Trypanosoma melophagium]|uniref:Flavoprotein pyridine nucleotide cytochrome reductase-like n=1 Tax=Trypanosoma melophagium TaxID=715481 RepID=UPI00351A8EA7|nr:Flavoprotein pyridine nucleotide cytochrome reductase-like [Trypanosoma melophagium]